MYESSFEKKSRGVISDEHSGHGVGPSLLIYLFGKFIFKNWQTTKLWCDSAPSCWRTTHGWNFFLTEVQHKAPTCPGKHMHLRHDELISEDLSENHNTQCLFTHNKPASSFNVTNTASLFKICMPTKNWPISIREWLLIKNTKIYKIYN